MIRRLVLALLPVAGFALGAALTALAGPAPRSTTLGGWHLAAAVTGCAALAVTAAALAAPLGGIRPAARRSSLPRSPRTGSDREDPPTLSGYWRAHDEPDWPEGEVRREREREEETAAER